MMNTVCWGMFGCGDVTEKKSAPGLYKSQNSKLKSVYSRSYDKAVDYAKRHNIEKVCRSIEEILSDKEITAVYIATPPKNHRDYAVAVLKAGKIPYIEKPLALNEQECLEIAEASKKYNLPAYAAYYRRGLEKYIYIKSLIDGGDLGKIRFMKITQMMKPEAVDLDRANLPWRLKMKEANGGKFADMATHVLDLAQYFLGDFVSAKGEAANFGGLYDVEDTVSATFKTTSGALVSGSWCYVADHDKEEIEIIGSKGRIITPGLDFSDVKVVKDNKEEIKEFKLPEHAAMPYEQMIINEILGKEKSPADFASAINNIRAIDAILKDYRKSVATTKP
ncbi:MAG: Gfo/Idh/MocA family oxidoreductase [Elusimicrobiota bacterium]|jgi:predicted dehydrogenase|nr:Gfo/Idh/MocA family oxidoreductase [Elusimicrobiota bacterium]